MKQHLSLCWFLLSAMLLFCNCEGRSLARYKRSDDPDPLETTVMQQAQTIAQLQAELASMKTQTANELNTLKSRMAQQETVVAFDTRVTGTLPFVNNEILILDIVALNIGNGYDKLTGVFTAPVSGYYLFTFKIGHDPPGRIHVYLYKNNHVMAEAEANGDDPKYIDRSSSTVVLHLVTGDKVYVKRAEGTSNVIRGGFATSFEGILVVADNL